MRRGKGAGWRRHRAAGGEPADRDQPVLGAGAHAPPDREARSARPGAGAAGGGPRIHVEDVAANRAMGDLGAALIQGPTDIITHCNAGALATGGYGTALGVVRSAHAAGKIRMVYADETRPWLQGSG
jgi:hypothetical protein